MRLAHTPEIKRPNLRARVYSRARSRSATLTRFATFSVFSAVLGLGIGMGIALPAQAESTVLLEAPVDRSGIAAVTFDDAGDAVGQSSFELEVLPNGNPKMTVRMAIEGGGQSISEATFAAVPVSIPSIGPAEKRSGSVNPQASQGSRASLPSVSSAPPIESAERSGSAEPSGSSEPGTPENPGVALPSLVGRTPGPLAGLRLIEQRSRSTRADGTVLELLIIDHAAGYMTCIPDGAAPDKGQRLALPKEDRVVNVPMQLFFLPLVRGEVDEIRFQIAMCKDGPALYEMLAVRGPRKNRGDREVLEIRYGPNLGKAVAFFASRLMPTFSFWFDAKTGGYLGHRMPLHRDGPEVTLVRSGISPPAIGLSWR